MHFVIGEIARCDKIRRSHKCRGFCTCDVINVCCVCVCSQGLFAGIEGLPLTRRSYGQAAFQDLRQQGDANPHARPRRCRQNQYPFHSNCRGDSDKCTYTHFLPSALVERLACFNLSSGEAARDGSSCERALIRTLCRS
jgi:hypothetical protein